MKNRACLNYFCPWLHNLLKTVNFEIFTELLDNKAKGRILKCVFQGDKARQIFRKTNTSYPLIKEANT